MEPDEKKIPVALTKTEWEYLLSCVHQCNSRLLQPLPDDIAVSLCNRICDEVGMK